MNNMIEHVFSLLCRKSIIDQDTNNLSISEVLERLTIQTEGPKSNDHIRVPVEFEIVSLWRKIVKDSFKGEIVITLLDPDKKVLHTQTVPLTIKPTFDRYRTRVRAKGIPVSKEGTYRFKISVEENGKESVVANIPLEVKISTKSA